MMAFWPLQSRSDIFFELYKDAGIFSLVTILFYPINALSIYFVSFLSKRIFHLRIIFYSILTNTILSFFVFGIQYHISDKHVSDAIFFTLMNTCILITATGIGFVISKNHQPKQINNGFGNFFKQLNNLSFFHQLMFLSLAYCVAFSYFFQVWPILCAFVFVGTYLLFKANNMNEKKQPHIEFKKYDKIVFIFIGVFLFLLGFFTMGPFICSIPWFHNFFTCYY